METVMIFGVVLVALIVAIISSQLFFTAIFSNGLKFVNIGLTGIGKKEFGLFGDYRYPCTAVRCLLFTVYDLPTPVAIAVKEVIGAGEDIDAWMMDRSSEIKEYKAWLYNEAFKDQGERSQERYDEVYKRYQEKLEEVRQQAKDLREMRTMVEETKKLFNFK